MSLSQYVRNVSSNMYHIFFIIKLFFSTKKHICNALTSFYLFFKINLTYNQCFKTRTGPAGRPGTRPTRAWDRSGWR
jgi:hypothetical protein